MSIPVDLTQLEQAAAEHDFAYLVTLNEVGAHVVMAQPVVADGQLTLGNLGRRSLANVVARPQVTFVWPPRSVDGYSLIVDGQATAGPGDGVITVAPARAVLHRSAVAAASTGGDACGSDCVEVPLQAEPA